MFLALTCLFTVQVFAQNAPDSKKRQPESFENFLMPGLGYVVHFPQNTNLGIFHGPSIEFVFYTQAEDRLQGPSHFRLYSRFNLLYSTQDSIKGMLIYGIGGSFSFERVIYRKFMIPYFGLELGGVSQSNVGGSAFQVTPILGLHLYSDENVSVNLYGAYSIAPRYYDEVSGPQGGLSVNVSFW